jgi:hypothetical protein
MTIGTYRLLVSAALVQLAFAYNHITRRQLLESHDSDDDNDNPLPLFPPEEEPLFLRPKHLEPGELASVVRRDNGEIIDPGTFFIGLPPELTERFQAYVQESGLLEMAEEVLYTNPVKRGDKNRFYKLKDGSLWGARVSNSDWVVKGDVTWIDPADEWTTELMLDIYRRSGYDKVLDTLAEKHGNEGLWVDGTSFIVVSHFEGENIHTDMEGMDDITYNLICPLIIPAAGGQLALADKETQIAMGSEFQFHQAVVLGGSSPHGTTKVDYRKTREFRMALSVFVDDIDEYNVYGFDDDTASFPPAGDLDYLLAQAGRHWGRHASLVTDKGRRPHPVEDDDPDNCPKWAEEGWCIKDVETRNACIKTCNVYLEDDIYYEKLGKLLNWPTETEE